jgi:hypothetical protein
MMETDCTITASEVRSLREESYGDSALPLPRFAGEGWGGGSLGIGIRGELCARHAPLAVRGSFEPTKIKFYFAGADAACGTVSISLPA